MTAIRTLLARGGGWRGVFFGGLAAAGAAIVVLAALATLVALAPWPGPDVHRPTSVAGIFHVHGEGSHDGYGTVDEAAAAAAKLGARFVVLTEHNHLSPPAPERRGGVLIVPGIEISSAHGHVIAVGLSRDPEDRGPTVLESIRRAGGAAILAHPVNRKRPWADPSPEGFAGFEALSLDSAFRDALATRWGRLALGAAALVGDRRKVGGLLVGRPVEALARYDEIVASRSAPLALVCGVDAHGLPPYEASFGALRLHVDVGVSSLATWGRSDAADAAAVVRAIRRAATFCSIPAFGDAGAFSFHAEREEIVASVPRDGVTIVLLRDGVEAFRGEGSRISVPRLPGAWRAEVRVDAGFPYGGERLWIASSALRIPPRPD
ncbi:MAG TPA: hypothetical protein VN033_11885 [Vulgatibacter sp.]|nr:hypothetical protein [Vulgatibacter sp.]